MGLTSWVVASISTWLVPVYVTAMVVIFVMPQVQHLEEAQPGGEPADVNTERASKASKPVSSDPDIPSAISLETDSPPGASATGTKPPGSMTPKRRHTRGRGRKPVEAGFESTVVVTPVAWIQIGPGKFVRADTQDQGHISALAPHTTLEAAKASIEAANAPPDVVEETNPPTVLTEVDVPIQADFNWSAPSPDDKTPSKESAAIVDPEPDSSTVALVLEANVARREFHSNAPATCVIDGNFPADSGVVEPVAEEYGIAPSTFSPGLLEAPLEEDHEQGWTGLSDFTGTGTKTPDEGDSNENGCNWIQFKLQPGLHTAAGCYRRLGMSQHLLNVHFGERGQALRKLDRSVNCQVRAKVRQDFGCASRVHRGYQPRSPPERS